MKVEEDSWMNSCVWSQVYTWVFGGWMDAQGAYEWIGMIGWMDTGMDRWRDKRVGRWIDGG